MVDESPKPQVEAQPTPAVPKTHSVSASETRDPLETKKSYWPAIARYYHDDPAATLPWLKQVFRIDRREDVREGVVKAIARYYHDDPAATLPWLKQAFRIDRRKRVRWTVTKVIEIAYPNDLDEQMRRWLQQHDER